MGRCVIVGLAVKVVGLAVGGGLAVGMAVGDELGDGVGQAWWRVV